jgi:hypothetical protein
MTSTLRNNKGQPVMSKRRNTLRRKLRKAADQPGTPEYQKLAENEGQQRLPLRDSPETPERTTHE